MEKQPETYSLIEISKWIEDNYIALPMVQRGFVWKVSQIENLWDSILRGYPLGAFVLSIAQLTQENGSKYNLVDGQQRYTSICLGFGFRPFLNETKQNEKSHKIFIDLEPPKSGDSREYIFRTITKSHPWGYQRIDNTKTLTSENRNKALDDLKVSDHLVRPLDDFIPYDSYLPIPLELFLKVASDINKTTHDLKRDIESWNMWSIVKAHWEKKIKDKTVTDDSVKLLTEEQLWEKVCEIYNNFKQILKKTEGQRVPVLYLPNKHLYNDNSEQDTVTSSINIDETDDDDSVDPVENLFIRLNAGGTPLRGEELNYSIIKSKINKNVQIKIENACHPLFAPARFITVMFRLYQCKNMEVTRDVITMKVKPKQFQRIIRSKLISFIKFVEEVINEKKYDNNSKTLLEYTQYILEFEPTINTKGIPYLVYTKISMEAPEVIFMLLYRLYIKEDKFKLDTDSHKKMMGIITLFTWYGKGEKNKNHSKLLQNIWIGARFLNQDSFWSSAIVQRAMLNEVLSSVPKLTMLRKLKNTYPRRNSDIFKIFDDTTNNSFIVDRIFSNWDLILYNQRHALKLWFKDVEYCLDDTNLPFDWDHIAANKFQNVKGISRPVKYMYNTIGNFRAWEYRLNRIDQDEVPSVKLNPLRSEDDNVKEQKKKSEKEWDEYYTYKIKEKFNPRKVSEDILFWSKCDKEWLNCTEINLKADARQVYSLILNRNINLYEEWYRNLLIEDIIPEFKKNEFNNILNNKWTNQLPAKIRNAYEWNDRWILKIDSNNDYKSTIYFYIEYDKSTKDETGLELTEDGISFGIIEDIKNGYVNRINKKIESVNNNKKVRSRYVYSVNDDYIFTTFTLVSYEDESYKKLFAEFSDWISIFPDDLIKEKLPVFEKSIKAKYQKKK